MATMVPYGANGRAEPTQSVQVPKLLGFRLEDHSDSSSRGPEAPQFGSENAKLVCDIHKNLCPSPETVVGQKENLEVR